MLAFEILWTDQAEKQFLELRQRGPIDKYIKISKTLRVLSKHGPKANEITLIMLGKHP